MLWSYAARARGCFTPVNAAFTRAAVLYQLDAGDTQIAHDQAAALAGKAFLDTDGHGNIAAMCTGRS